MSDEEKALKLVVEALVTSVAVFRFDLKRMIEWGPDYNQAVKDAHDKMTAALEAIAELGAIEIGESPPAAAREEGA